MKTIREMIDLVEAAETVTLFHGTLAQNISTIECRGLEARVGEFVCHAYADGNEDTIDELGLEELVFLADERGLAKCISAIANMICHHHGADDGFSEDLIRQYGALCIIHIDRGWIEHLPHDEHNDGSHPSTVERGDYYSRTGVRVDKIIVGDELIAFFAAHGGRVKNGRYSIWANRE